VQQAADLCRCHGGIVRIKRTIIIPAILALSAAGSIAASSAAIAAAAPTAQVLAVSSSAHTQMFHND
jgi:hypothetical protein